MKVVALILVVVAVILITQWLIAQFFLTGAESPERWLHIDDDTFVSKNPESAEHRRIAQEIQESNKQAPPPGVDSIQLMRSRMDTPGKSVSPQSRVLAFESAELTGDWLIPPAAVPGRRLLYLHGGGYTAGSALSHRSIADRLAIRLRTEVFLPNYRLIPEHGRADGIHDCRTAYR
ncbi:MAG: alpha/beta hydrolase [Gammaproteobacteria bacterium]|nr:alpha/beta hydrolase [Gammaproteobacteria bacterium]